MEQTLRSIDEVFQWMDKQCVRAIQPGLERMEWMLERLGNPHRRCKFIHIAGTNGKGSTAALISSVLQKAGYATGLYISPSVTKWNERIQVDGEGITDTSFIYWANRLRPIIEEMSEGSIGPPSPFEFYTLLAMCYFAFDASPWFVVLETGLGGRLDATNVVYPLISIITRIGIDHEAYLGESIEEITEEKLGIIKPGVPVVVSKQEGCVQQLIEKKAKRLKSPLYLGGRDFFVQSEKSDEEYESFQFSNVYNISSSYQIPLLGKHQIQNASTALMALHVLVHHYATILEEEHVRIGLKKVFWPGRLEKVAKNPLVILDGAHNPDGFKVLMETIERKFQNKKLYVMLAVLKDKNPDEMVSFLSSSSVEKIVTTEIEDQLCYSMEELACIIKKTIDVDVIPFSVQEGLGQLKKWASGDDVILVTGSLYLVSLVRPYFINNNAKDGDGFA